MNCSRSNILVLVSLLCLMQLPAWSLDFPGKGDYQAWLTSYKVYLDGNELARQGKFPEAAVKFQQAIDNYPMDPHFYVNLATCLKHTEQFQLSESITRKALTLDPTLWSAWNNLGNVLYGQGKYRESREAFQKALDNNPPPDQIESVRNAIRIVDKQLATTSNH